MPVFKKKKPDPVIRPYSRLLGLASVYLVASVADRITDCIDGVADSSFKFAPGFLRLTLGPLCLAFSLETSVACDLTGLVLDPAFGLFPFAFSLVAIWY
jgi:hypothetical protein